MALNRYIILDGLLWPGDNSTNSASAVPDVMLSSTAVASEKPKLHKRRWGFSQSVDQYLFAQFQMPGDFNASGTTARLRFKQHSAQTSGDVVWKAGIGEASGAITDDTYNAADQSTVTISGT